MIQFYDKSKSYNTSNLPLYGKQGLVVQIKRWSDFPFLLWKENLYCLQILNATNDFSGIDIRVILWSYRNVTISGDSHLR